MTSAYDDLIRQARQAAPAERRQLLDDLVAQFAEAAYRWAVVVLQDENAAYDAVQEAWLNAYLHLDQLRESAAFPAWFRQIVITSSHHTRRDEKPALPLTEDAPADLADSAEPTNPAEAIEAKERLERVREAVQALPEHERIVTELFYFGEASQQEIAEVLAVPVTTVKKRLQYARQKLKGMIQPDIMASLEGLDTSSPERDEEEEAGLPLMEWSPFIGSSASVSFFGAPVLSESPQSPELLESTLVWRIIPPR
jgi:RNA polymerase sigma factor (sigma-70 family)